MNLEICKQCSKYFKSVAGFVCFASLDLQETDMNTPFMGKKVTAKMEIPKTCLFFLEQKLSEE